MYYSILKGLHRLSEERNYNGDIIISIIIRGKRYNCLYSVLFTVYRTKLFFARVGVGLRDSEFVRRTDKTLRGIGDRWLSRQLARR